MDVRDMKAWLEKPLPQESKGTGELSAARAGKAQKEVTGPQDLQRATVSAGSKTGAEAARTVI